MSKKKDHGPEELNEREKLNRRVDAMMDPKLPDPSPSARNGTPPLDIFKDAPADVTKATKTAPEVSGKLLDRVDDSKEELAPESNRPEPKPQIKAPKPATTPKSRSQDDPPKDSVDQKDPLDDVETDKAVSDIAAKEGNTLLALQDAIGRKASHVAGDLAEGDRRKTRHRHWAWFIFLACFVIFILLAMPLNPYTCRWPVGIRLSVTTDILPSVCK